MELGQRLETIGRIRVPSHLRLGLTTASNTPEGIVVQAVWSSKICLKFAQIFLTQRQD